MKTTPRQRTPVVKTTTPKQKTPVVKTTTPRQRTPVVKTTTPRQRTPIVRRKTPVVRRAQPKILTKTPTYQAPSQILRKAMVNKLKANKVIPGSPRAVTPKVVLPTRPRIVPSPRTSAVSPKIVKGSIKRKVSDVSKLLQNILITCASE